MKVYFYTLGIVQFIASFFVESEVARWGLITIGNISFAIPIIVDEVTKRQHRVNITINKKEQADENK